jgi:hypothetical protein
MRAALLALMLLPDHPARVRAWREETVLVPEAEDIRADVERLGPTTRLPYFELLLARLGGTPLADRQLLLRAARRVQTAPTHPLDRLTWLALRRQFGDHPAGRVLAPGESTISRLPAADLHHIVVYTAYLARMVPGEVDAPEGLAWYETVLGRWMQPGEWPAWQRPDVDALVHALNGLQAMSWMQRPQLVRTWVGAALAPGQITGLPAHAADALRLSCLLLDTPMPPELARHYQELQLG